MRSVAVLLALLSVAPAVRAADASAVRSADAPPAAAGDVLLVDFVEYGRVDRSVPRDLAMVDLVNLSGRALDIVIGEGSATVEPKERIIARVKAGDQEITVTDHAREVAPIEGKLHLDAGVRYQLALGFGPPPPTDEPGDSMTSGAPVSKGPEIAPMPGAAAPAATTAPAPATTAQPAKKEPPRKKSGKVDVGRRR